MKLSSKSIKDNEFMDPKFAIGKPDPEKYFVPSDNYTPHLSWSDVPDRFYDEEAIEAMKPHILDEATITVKYTLNPNLLK